MKRLVSSLVLVSTLIFPASVLAVDSSTSATAPVGVKQLRQDFKAQAQVQKEAFQAKLKGFKDQRKATLTEKVSTNLNKINQNRTEHFLKFLDKAAAILDRLDTRVARADANGKDTTAAKAAIAKARTSVANARSAVTAQAGKDYTFNVTSEAGVKASAQIARDSLRKDLEAIRKVVMGAKDAVMDAVRAVAKVSGEKMMKSGTTSGETKQ